MRIEQPSTIEAPIKFQRAAASVNILATTLGMLSLGLLAMLIIHHSLESEGFRIAAIGAIDAITFSTNIIGKIAIVLYFNGPVFDSLVKQFYQSGIKSFFTIPKRTFWQHLAQAFNYFLSLNASLFWAGLVQITFIKSADLLDEFNSNKAHAAASLIRQWYFYLAFVVCSFYANWLSWPGIHQAAYDQKKSLLQWILEPYRWLKTSVAFQLEQAHQKILDELKAVINTKSEDRNSKLTPRITALVEALNQQEKKPKQPESPPINLNDKLDYIIQAKRSPQQWRKAYLQTDKQHSSTLSAWEWGTRHAFALLFTVIGVWGYHNVMGLSDVIWANWSASIISTYFARYAVFYSMAEVIMLIVHPMIYGLVGMLNHGIPSHVFSKLKLGFILATIFGVGICSGLANAEQSDLDHESIFDIVIAGIAAFLTDSFGIYMVFRRFFESRINDSKKPDETTTLEEQYLKLREKGESMVDINDLSGEAVVSLVENNSLTIHLESPADEEQFDENRPLLMERKLVGERYRMFSSIKNCFSTCFSTNDPEKNAISLN